MKKKNQKVLYGVFITAFILIIITAGIFFSTFFTGFAPLDDYIIYDDFSDTNYEASSSLQTIQIEAGETKTITLSEDTKLVIARPNPPLPDFNQHTFYVNGKSVSLSKTNYVGYTSLDNSIILFDLSHYQNKIMDFGENIIKTDFPLEIYISTGYCVDYVTAQKIHQPQGANFLSGQRIFVGANRKRNIHCYYPKWSMKTYYRLYSNVYGLYQIPYLTAGFKPTFSNDIGMYNSFSAKDFKNSDIKIKYYSNLQIEIVSFKDNLVYNEIENSVLLPTLKSTAQDHIVEIIHSNINQGELHIYNDGTYIGNVMADFNNYHLKLTNPVGAFPSSGGAPSTIGVTGSINYVKFRLPFNCKIFDDEQLVYEDYYPEEVIKLDENFKLSEDGCEVMKFCLAHPTVLSEQSGSSTDYENEIYQSLVSGKALTVPSDQTWKLIFITKKDSEGRCEKYTPTFINETYTKELEIKVSSLESEISTLNQLIAERNLIKDDLETSINDMDNEIVILQDNLDQQTITIAELQVQLESKEEKTDELQVLISQAQTQIDDLITILQEKENLIKELISERLSQENRILELLENLQEKEEKLAEIEGMSDAQIAELERIKDMFDEQKAKIIELQGIVDEDYTIIDGIKQDNDDMKYTLKELTDKNEELKDKTDELSETVTQEQQKAEEFKVLLEATKQTVETLKQENIEQKESFIKIKELSNEQEALLDELKKKNKELENILNEKKDFNWLYVIIPVFLLLVIVIFLIAKPKKKKRKKK